MKKPASVIGDIAADRKSVTLDFSAVTKLDARGMQQLIHVLAQFREQLEPPVPLQKPEGTEGIPLPNPNWLVLRRAEGGANLLMRHRGLGWIGCEIPAASAENLANSLLQALQPAKPQSPKKGH